MLSLALVSAASAGTVCASGQTGCTYADLALALRSEDSPLELQPGTHFAGLEVDATVDLTALPGAVLKVTAVGQPALWVNPTASGSTFSGLVYDCAGPSVDGPLVTVDGADVTVTDAVIERATGAGAPPGFEVLDGGALTLVGATIVDSLNVGDGMIRVDGSSLTVTGGVFAANSAARGGTVWARDSVVTITDAAFDATYAYEAGNALWMRNGELVITNATFAAQTSGTMLDLSGLRSATLTGGSFSGANSGARAVDVDFTGAVEIDGTGFFDWEDGAVAVGVVESLTVIGAVFASNRTTGSGGALSVVGVRDLVIDGAWFCDNRADGDGGAVDLGPCAGSCAVTGSVFQDNRSDGRGGAITTAGALSIDHGTFRANEGSPGAAVYGAAGAAMETSIVVGQRGTGAALSFSEQGFDTNGLGDNEESDASFPIPATNRTDLDVVFQAGDGVCGESVALADVAANRWLLDHGVGAGLEEKDLDGDGAPTHVDCDDTRPDVYPGAVEVPADGIDEDCDQLELCPVDADGDGYGTDQDLKSERLDCSATRGDCNDLAPAVNPGATEVWYDGTDSDCSGDDFDQDLDGVRSEADCDDTDPALGICAVRVGGGCRIGPAPGAFGWLVALAFRRSRRSRGR